MLGTRPKPLKGYPQWVREGTGNRGEPEGPPTLPPLVHWIASSHPLLLGFLPLAPFKKKYKAFLHNFSLFLPLPTLLEFPPSPYSLTSCTPPSSYSPRLLTPLSFSIRGTNRNKINFLKKQPNGNIWTHNCMQTPQCGHQLQPLALWRHLLQNLCFKWVITSKHPHWFSLF